MIDILYICVAKVKRQKTSSLAYFSNALFNRLNDLDVFKSKNYSRQHRRSDENGLHRLFDVGNRFSGLARCEGWSQACTSQSFIRNVRVRAYLWESPQEIGTYCRRGFR